MIGGREAPAYVAFTFDDGPEPKITRQILDTLELYEVPATFFAVGRHFAKNTDGARAGADLLREMEERGFSIGNHTTDHQNLPTLSLAQARQAIAKNANDLATVLGHPVHLFRPPYGATTGPLRRMLHKRGDTVVRWNIDSRDYARGERTGVGERVLGDIIAKNGGVVLMHDTKPWTARALPDLLDKLELANCQRLKDGKSPIVPVSLHYFLRNKSGAPRPIPPEVLKATQKTLDRLSKRCKNVN